MATFRVKNIVAGTISGIAVWFAYATVEFLLLSLTPLLLSPGSEWNAPFWHAMVLLLGAYAAIGALAGAIIGAAMGPPRPDFPNREVMAATITLPLAFVANLLSSGHLSGSASISVAIALALTVSLGVSLRSETWRGRLGLLNGPLAVSALLLAPPWIGRDLLANRSSALQFGVILAGLFTIVLFSLVFHRIRTVALPPHRYLAGIVAAFILASAAGIAISPGSPRLPARKINFPADRPNVILIVMDTARADHTSLYGYGRDTTPNLRELANGATLYTNAVAVSDMTLPTHASMFTGLYPRTHGAHFAPPNQSWGRPLAAHFTTLAEVLQGSGYRTLASVANSGYLAPWVGLDQGFEAYDWRFPIAVDGTLESFSLRPRVHSLLEQFMPAESLDFSTRAASEITDSGLGLTKQADGPFFLFLNYMDAHLPYTSPASFIARYPCGDRRLIRDQIGSAREFEVAAGTHKLTREEQDCISSAYDAGITYIDSSLAKLFAELKQRGMYDSSLIIVTGDHGEALGDHGQLSHGGISVYREQIAVPLLIKYPGQKQREIVDNVVSQVDFMPTILEVAGIPQTLPSQGESLRGIQAKDPARLVYSICYPFVKWIEHAPKYDRTLTAVVGADRKLILSNKGDRELYDTVADHAEQNNLLRTETSRAEVLESALTQWLGATPVDRTGASLSNTPENIRRLKSLGYVQ